MMLKQLLIHMQKKVTSIQWSPQPSSHPSPSHCLSLSCCPSSVSGAPSPPAPSLPHQPWTPGRSKVSAPPYLHEVFLQSLRMEPWAQGGAGRAGVLKPKDHRSSRVKPEDQHLSPSLLRAAFLAYHIQDHHIPCVSHYPPTYGTCLYLLAVTLMLVIGKRKSPGRKESPHFLMASPP